MKTAVFAAVVVLSACSRSATREERLAGALRERSTYCDERPRQSLEEVLAAVQNVDPLVVVHTNGKQTFAPKLVGARVSVRALHGITQQWLERTLHCHQAQRTLDSASAPAIDADPFWLPDGWVQVQVLPVQGAFVTELRGSTDEEAGQIYSQAQQLMAHHIPSN
jgi:hypothetical protein